MIIKIYPMVFVIIALTLAPHASAALYDLVINSGRVMDPETKYDRIANVGIKNGTIAITTNKSIKGKETIDATGHVVVPRFIDIHAHGQNIGDCRLSLKSGSRM